MKWIFTVSMASAGIFLVAASAQDMFRGKTMSAKDAEKRWGSSKFISEEFKTGSDEVRAKMAVYALKNKKDYVGSHALKVRDLFGSTSGFYPIDRFPTYIIHRDTKEGKDTWQLVFLLGSGDTVRDVIIHNN